jgi:hypothetical protein
VFRVVACDGPLPVDYRASPYSDTSSDQDIDYKLDFDTNPELSSRIWFDPDVLGAAPGVIRVLTSMESTELFLAVQMSDCSVKTGVALTPNSRVHSLVSMGIFSRIKIKIKTFLRSVRKICECYPVGIVINLKLRKLRCSVPRNSD